MRQGRHDFDRLHAWAALTDAELGKLVDADSIAALRRVVWLLGGERAAGVPVDVADFVATVRAMERLYREAARSLGEAMAEAHEWGARQDSTKARAAYERFIASCGSEFHRDVARFQLRRLGVGIR
jgi:hypothetical protein